ncbi:MAG: hypothetical protein R2879_08795 [Saprospiraceae bacterium]
MWENNLKLFDALVDLNPNFDRKGKSMPYTSANGYMFSLLNKEGQFGIRLPKESAKSFQEKYDSGPFKSHGAFMKDYVLVPDDLLSRPEELEPYLQESYEYVMSLPPK